MKKTEIENITDSENKSFEERTNISDSKYYLKIILFGLVVIILIVIIYVVEDNTYDPGRVSFFERLIDKLVYYCVLCFMMLRNLLFGS